MLPVLFELPFFTLYSYPLFMGLSWGVGFYLTKYLFEKNALATKSLPMLFLGIFLSSWVGAKIFFLFFSSQQKMDEYFYADAFWLGGGFVFYGGLIFGIIFYFIYSLGLKKISFSSSKLLLPGLTFGHAIGRVGCFLAGCCFGKESHLPWAVRMHEQYRHPVQLYEAVGLFVLGFLILKWVSLKKNNTIIIAHYLIFYSGMRFVVEFFRGDAVRGLFTLGLSTSQLISIFIFLFALGAKTLWHQGHPYTPGH